MKLNKSENGIRKKGNVIQNESQIAKDRVSMNHVKSKKGNDVQHEAPRMKETSNVNGRHNVMREQIEIMEKSRIKDGRKELVLTNGVCFCLYS